MTPAATVQLGEVCDVIMGQAPEGATYNSEGLGLPLLAGAGDLGELEPEPTRFTSEPTRIARPGDIILCVRATLGKTNWARREYCLGRGVAALRAKPSLLDPGYLWHWIATQGLALEGKARGSTFRQVTRSAVESLRIPVSPLPEQQRIAAILDKADAVRRKRQQTLDLADQFLRSAFLDMFGDPVTNPKGWPVKKLGTCADIQGGLQVTTKRAGNPIEVPYLRVANVYRDSLDLAEIKTIPVTLEELARAALAKGDVLVVEGHGNREEIGRSAVWDGSIRQCTHQNHLIRVRACAGVLEPEYLSFYLNSAAGRRQMLRSGKTTSGLNTISTRNVKDTEILLPPLDEQARFVVTRYLVRTMSAQLVTGLSVMAELRGSAAQRAFVREP